MCITLGLPNEKNNYYKIREVLIMTGFNINTLNSVIQGRNDEAKNLILWKG